MQDLGLTQVEEPLETEESLGLEKGHHPGNLWLLGQSCILTSNPWVGHSGGGEGAGGEGMEMRTQTS